MALPWVSVLWLVGAEVLVYSLHIHAKDDGVLNPRVRAVTAAALYLPVMQKAPLIISSSVCLLVSLLISWKRYLPACLDDLSSSLLQPGMYPCAIPLLTARMCK